MLAWSYLILPGCCVLCDQYSDCQQDLCAACEQQLTQNLSHCDCCGVPMASPVAQCSECLSEPPAFTSTIAPLIYQDVVIDLVHRFKYLHQHACGRVLINQLQFAIQKKHSPLPDVLVPVPSYWRKQLVRGFNPPDFIAEQLGKTFSIPVCLQALKKIRPGKSQASLSRTARQKNLAHLYTVNIPSDIQGKHVALVDDVMTTGATARRLGSLLRAAGAKRVDVWVLARTAR